MPKTTPISDLETSARIFSFAENKLCSASILYFNFNVEDGTRRDPKSRFAKFAKPNPFFIRPRPHHTARRLPTPVQYVPGRNLDTAWPTNGALGGQAGAK